jgi:acyl carrier protein
LTSFSEDTGVQGRRGRSGLSALIDRKWERPLSGLIDEITARRVLDLISDELGLEPDLQLDTPIFSSGLLDSIDIINLLLILEEAFGVRIEPSKVDIDHLDTAIRIAGTLQRRREG